MQIMDKHKINSNCIDGTQKLLDFLVIISVLLISHSFRVVQLHLYLKV